LEQSNIVFSSDIIVDLIKHSASDTDVAFAAKVSTKGQLSYREGFAVEDTEKLAGLINFLARERHGSPFEHSVFTFYVKAPIFVWREHMRHRIASYNEESGRYRVLEPHFYVPGPDRKLVQVGKTGSYTFEEGNPEQMAITLVSYRRTCKEAYSNYMDMINAGVAREVARGVLPVTIYSSAYVTMNARALMNFLSLRVNAEGSKFPSYPQREIEMVAERYEQIFKEVMPITYDAFIKNGRVAP
jgi:thymidylate synthase (FAD)